MEPSSSTLTFDLHGDPPVGSNKDEIEAGHLARRLAQVSKDMVQMNTNQLTRQENFFLTKSSTKERGDSFGQPLSHSRGQRSS